MPPFKENQYSSLRVDSGVVLIKCVVWAAGMQFVCWSKSSGVRLSDCLIPGLAIWVDVVLYDLTTSVVTSCNHHGVAKSYRATSNQSPKWMSAKYVFCKSWICLWFSVRVRNKKQLGQGEAKRLFWLKISAFVATSDTDWLLSTNLSDNYKASSSCECF